MLVQTRLKWLIASHLRVVKMWLQITMRIKMKYMRILSLRYTMLVSIVSPEPQLYLIFVWTEPYPEPVMYSHGQPVYAAVDQNATQHMSYMAGESNRQLVTESPQLATEMDHSPHPHETQQKANDN